MNKYLSILQLNIRRSLGRLLAVLAVFAAGELGWFARRLSANPQMSLYAAGRTFGICFVICMALSAVALGWRSTKGSVPEYSLGLLAVSGKASCIISLPYDLAAMLLAWAAQIMTLYAAIRIYMSSAGYTGGPQGAIVEMYSVPALTVILPLEQSKYWYMGALCAACLALAAARMEQVRTRGGFPVLSLLTILAAGFSMYARVEEPFYYNFNGGLLSFACFLALLSIAFGLASSRKGRKEEDDGE